MPGEVVLGPRLTLTNESELGAELGLEFVAGGTDEKRVGEEEGGGGVVEARAALKCSLELLASALGTGRGRPA